MRPILLKDVKRGEFFTLTDKVKHNDDGTVNSVYVYVRDAYIREDKKYEVHKFDDFCRCSYFKGTRRVWVDFLF